MADPIALKALKQSVTAGMKVELTAIAPEILTDPDVEITYDPGKTEIGENAYQDNTDVVVAYFPNVEKIGKNAFGRCEKLKAAYFPKLKTVASTAFQHCYALETFYAPNAEDVASNAFDTCKVLREVALPNVKKITYGVFINCDALEKAEFSSATEMENHAFRATALNTLILHGDTVCYAGYAALALGSTAIASGTGFIYVPAALIEEYKAAPMWSGYKNQFRAIEDYPEICDPDIDKPITKGEAIELVNRMIAAALAANSET